MDGTGAHAGRPVQEEPVASAGQTRVGTGAIATGATALVTGWLPGEWMRHKQALRTNTREVRSHEEVLRTARLALGVVQEEALVALSAFVVQRPETVLAFLVAL